MKSLTDKGFKAIGTIGDNRIKKATLMSNKKLKAKKRGDIVVMEMLCWLDGMTTAWLQKYQTGQLRLNFKQSIDILRKTNKKFPFKSQKSFSCITQHMGDVDLLDRLLSSYRPKIRSKKWW